MSPAFLTYLCAFIRTFYIFVQIYKCKHIELCHQNCAKEFDKNVILRSNYFAGSTLLVDVLLFEVRVVECNLVWSQDFYIENRFGSFCKYSYLSSGFYIVVFNQLLFKSRRSFTRPPGGLYSLDLWKLFIDLPKSLTENSSALWKYFSFAPEILKINLASPQIPQNISQFSLFHRIKCTFFLYFKGAL